MCELFSQRTLYATLENVPLLLKPLLKLNCIVQLQYRYKYFVGEMSSVKCSTNYLGTECHGKSFSTKVNVNVKENQQFLVYTVLRCRRYWGLREVLRYGRY